ncbi:hypothetical protein AB0D91_05325 [Streptomyces canus]|uniref:hypothetical protein n=1 Tax=Streptomyces canus TaxID=58343 RepID=UPI0033E89C87
MATPKQSRRERRETAYAAHQHGEQKAELRMTAIAVANGGDSDLGAFRKVARRMTPGVTDAEIREAYDWARRR